MVLHTKIQPNGDDGKYEVVWSTTMKVIAGVFTVLITAGVLSSIALNTKVAVMQHQLEDIDEKIERHLDAEEKHEGVETKTDRIDRIVNEELEHHIKEWHRR